MSTALLAPLRLLYPQAELGFWVKDYARELFDFPAGVVRIHAADPFWDRAPGRGKGSLRKFLKVLAEIRRRKYDLVFVLDSDWRRALACALAGIPNRVGFGGRKSEFFLSKVVDEKKGGHVIESHAQLLSAWAERPVPADWFKPNIGISQDQKNRGLAWKRGLGWQDRVVAAMHLISGDPEKDWPLDAWAVLIKKMRAQYPALALALLSSPKEEAALRGALGAVLAGQVQIVVCSIAKMKEVLSQANLFIGGDSGPGHMAAALGVPVVSLFGPTDPARFRPVGLSPVRVIRRNPLIGLPEAEVAGAVSELSPAVFPPRS